MNGAINVLFPVLGFPDGALASIGVSPVLRVVLWGAVSGAIATLFYRLVSNQDRIRCQKDVARMSRKTLSAAEDAEPADVLRLALANLRVSFRLLGMVFIPSLLSSLPVLVVMVWVSTQFAFTPLSEGQSVSLKLDRNLPGIGVTVDGHTIAAVEPGTFLTRMSNDSELRITLAGGLLFTGRVNDPPVAVVHKRKWWNFLVGNPAGYLEADGPLEEIRIQRERRRLAGGVPLWMGTWEFFYFATLMVVAFGLKRALRVE